MTYLSLNGSDNFCLRAKNKAIAIDATVVTNPPEITPNIYSDIKSPFYYKVQYCCLLININLL